MMGRLSFKNGADAEDAGADRLAMQTNRLEGRIDADLKRDKWRLSCTDLKWLLL